MGSLLVQISARHRADGETDARLGQLGPFTAVIDLEPAELLQPTATSVGGVGCSTCSLVSFLRGVDDLGRYRGLLPTRTAFEHWPDLVHAIGRGDVERVRALASAIGAASIRELAPVGRPRRLRGLPVVHLVGGAAGAEVGDLLVNRDDRALIQPDRHGPAWVLAHLRRLRDLGLERATIGYHQHAAAIDGWSGFVERDGFAAEWQAMVLGARRLGYTHLGLAMAFPPCAALQWRVNDGLERLRARLDLQLRRLDGESSMMCPENVSGYGLLDDTRAFVHTNGSGTPAIALRVGPLLLEL